MSLTDSQLSLVWVNKKIMRNQSHRSGEQIFPLRKSVLLSHWNDCIQCQRKWCSSVSRYKTYQFQRQVHVHPSIFTGSWWVWFGSDQLWCIGFLFSNAVRFHFSCCPWCFLRFVACIWPSMSFTHRLSPTFFARCCTVCNTTGQVKHAKALVTR